jgi:hypothetical protein
LHIPPIVLAALTGVGIAAAAGLRAFLPLFVVGLAGRFGLLHLRAGSEWLTGDTALWALGIAAVLEIVADKVPVVDHALDMIGVVLRPVAAWVGAYAVLSGWGSPWAELVAIIFGAGALAIQGVKAKARVGSTAMTAGHANPVLSLLEDTGALTLLWIAILVPVAAVLLLVLAIWAFRRWRRRRLPPPNTAAILRT